MDIAQWEKKKSEVRKKETNSGQMETEKETKSALKESEFFLLSFSAQQFNQLPNRWNLPLPT